MGKEEIIIRLEAAVYLKFNKKLNLSLDDCDQIVDFIIKEHDDWIVIKDEIEVHNLVNPNNCPFNGSGFCTA